MNDSKRQKCISAIILFCLAATVSVAYGAYGDHDGPYGENDGIHGGNRLDPSQYPPMDDSILGWATQVVDYDRTADITHGDPEIVLGQPGGTSDVFSLGDGGWIIVSFDGPIANLPGPDFVVWENGFLSRQPGELNHLWAELLFVEVSTNGQDYIRFPSINGVPNPLGGFSCLDPTYIHNVAGKHPNGNDGKDEGTPFDLEDLSEHPMVVNGTVNLERINFVRLVDVVGDGSTTDSQGKAMYDPFPTPFGTGGADVDAVGVLNYYADPGPRPTPISPEDGAGDVGLMPQLESSSITMPDGESHIRSRWQIAHMNDFNDPAALMADIHTTTQLTSLGVPNMVLAENTTYYWRVQFYFQQAAPSEWSAPFSFTTRLLSAEEKDDGNEDGVPDSQQNVTLTDLDAMDGEDADQPDIKTLRTQIGDIHAGLKIQPHALAIEKFRSMDPTSLGVVGESPNNMPFGALEFKLKVDVGDSIHIDIYLSEVFSAEDQWFIFTPQSDWVDITDKITFTPIDDTMTRIGIMLTDGGPEDYDGVANGWILSTGGIVKSSNADDTPTPTGDDTPSNDAGGGGGGCFILQILNQRR